MSREEGARRGSGAAETEDQQALVQFIFRFCFRLISEDSIIRNIITIFPFSLIASILFITELFTVCYLIIACGSEIVEVSGALTPAPSYERENFQLALPLYTALDCKAEAFRLGRDGRDSNRETWSDYYALLPPSLLPPPSSLILLLAFCQVSYPKTLHQCPESPRPNVRCLNLVFPVKSSPWRHLVIYTGAFSATVPTVVPTKTGFRVHAKLTTRHTRTTTLTSQMCSLRLENGKGR